jgi:RNA polymerase sigma-70 factor (ECF subfamily)
MDPSDHVWRERGLRSAVLAGDERAWQTWYDESFADLAAYVAWRCAGLRDLSEDIVQETWLTALGRIRSFDPVRGTFVSWLCGIAANLLRNRLRKQQRRAAQQYRLNGHYTAPAADEAEKRDRAERIAQALAALPERYEAVLRAKYLDQQSMAQIAQTWNETPKAVESLLTRARQAFREAYQHEERDSRE